MTSVDVELGLTAVAAMLSPTTLTFCVLALVLSTRPGRTGVWFFIGAFGATIVAGIVAAFVLGNAAAPSKHSSTPPTWAAIFDLVASVLLIGVAVHTLRRPPNPKRISDAINKMTRVSSSPAIAILAAGAALANPGAFIPIALKDISQLGLSTAGYVALWLGFTVMSLLPLLGALVAIAVSREWTVTKLQTARGWLERHARTMAAVIIVLLAAALLRNGIAGLTG